MPTAKAILYTRYKSKDDTYPINIRLIDGVKQKLHPIGFKILEKYWNDGQVSRKHPDAEIINSVIDSELLKAKRYFADCKIKGIPVDLSLAFTEVKSHSFTGYLRHRAKQYGERDSPEMELKLNRLAKELTACFGKELYFTDINADLLRDYNNYLIKVPNAPNTRAKKFEFLGRYYNNAINEGKALAPNPFKEFKVPGTAVKREKLTFDELKAIEDLKLKPGPVNDARNAFMVAYYVRGIRFQNVITLKWEDIQEGRIHYQAVKNGPFLSAKIHDKLKGIFDFYRSDREFILPFVTVWPEKKAEQRKIVGPRNVVVNRNLKTVAELAGIDKDLSMHIARHTLAYHMKHKTKSIHVISDALGQSRTATTEKYLKSLDDSIIDVEMDKIYG